MSVDADAQNRATYQLFLEFERFIAPHSLGQARPYNVTPIGYCAFALTLFVYSMIMCGAAVPVNTAPSMAMGLALFYGGLIQFLAGLFELNIGNNFNSLIFCSYAGYWFSLAALYAKTIGFISGIFISDISLQYKCLGIFYLGWTIFTILMLIASLRTNVVMILFLLFLCFTYALFTASYFFQWDASFARAGGAIGIFTSSLLWYAGFASFMKKGDNSNFNLPIIGLEPNISANLK